jgi:3-isopropylmalate dehydratase small subunit
LGDYGSAPSSRRTPIFSTTASKWVAADRAGGRCRAVVSDVAAFPGFKLVIDLEEQTVATTDGGTVFPFSVDAFRKHCLLNGLDDIALTLNYADEIRAFEAKRKAEQPWLF